MLFLLLHTSIFVPLGDSSSSFLQLTGQAVTDVRHSNMGEGRGGQGRAEEGCRCGV